MIKEQVLYLCDPKKNKGCTVPCCYGKPNIHPDWGECKYTDDPKYSKDGKEYWYNPETSKYETIKK